MPQGLQVFDAAGNVIVDTSTRLGRVLGSATIGPSGSGSITNASFALGTPWCMIYNSSSFPTYEPVISFSGTSLLWSFAYTSSSYTIVYGIY